MNALIAIALKSLIIAGLTLVALRLAHRRSAAERSWIAHVGLLAIIILPLAPLAIPQIAVETAAFEAANPPPVAVEDSPRPTVAAPEPHSQEARQAAPAADSENGWSMMEVSSFLYWIPTLLLLSITLIALARLVALRSRAEVLVDSHWLSALARAQRRMGFKHGTALLTSNDLPSPISWGLMRPVILLNAQAVEAAEDAEAIIAHELAHVARLDWIKLLLARVATALFWFNPLVWMIAREAHQLREEAADDTVLAADIEDTDYAQLLVGVARHECRGLLIGAHGVAPSKGSLARRVARVLDSRSPRGPVERSFAAGVFFGAVATATPLAALTLVPAQIAESSSQPAIAQTDSSRGYYPAGGVPLPKVVSTTVSGAVDSAVASAVATVAPGWGEELQRDLEVERIADDTAQVRKAALASAAAATRAARIAATTGPRPETLAPRPGSLGPRPPRLPDPVDEAIALKAVGGTPEYARSIRAAAPQLANVGTGELTSLRALGVTPAYVEELRRAGQMRLDAKSLIELRALGVRGDYIRGMAAAGYPNLSSGMLAQMKALGITPQLVRHYRQEGLPHMTAQQLVSMRAVDMRGTPTRRGPRISVTGPNGARLDVDADVDVDIDVDGDVDHDDGS